MGEGLELDGVRTFDETTDPGTNTPNIGIWVPSSEVTFGSARANQDGLVNDVRIDHVDIAIDTLERANAHVFNNILANDVGETVIRMTGTTGNTLGFGLCTGSPNGVVCLDINNGVGTNTVFNQCIGFQFEPGGTGAQAGIGWDIENNCKRNTLIFVNNGAGTVVDAASVAEGRNINHIVDGDNFRPGTIRGCGS